MRRTLAICTVVAALAAAALAPLAEARMNGRPRPAPLAAAQVQVSGTGAITLSGGLAVVGTVGAGSGGRLSVVDMAGDARATLNGRPVARRGAVKVPNRGGSFYVKGSRVRVRVMGVSLSVSAAGRGRALFEGVGTYMLNGAAAQPWSNPPVTIELLPPGT
jgi:hypothetical protein